ncbi:hypothetical protein DFP72DRAFT_1116696, partial [Ephemerocybe angulata]
LHLNTPRNRCLKTSLYYKIAFEPGWKIQKTQPPMPSTVSSTKPTTGVDDSDSIPIKFTVGPDSLPIEIYGEIFGWLRVASNNPSLNAINVTGLVLRQVSKLWEKAVLSYPEFWAQIYHNCSVIPSRQDGIKGLIVSKGPCAPSKDLMDFIQAQAFLNHKAAMYITSYARLSGTMPLELSLKLPFRVNSTELDVLFILEQSIIERVQYLVLELSVSAACHLASRISSTAGNKVWSQLEKLKLVIHGSNPDPTFRTYVNSGTAGGRSLMPRLTNLRLEIYRFPNSEDLNGTSFLALGFPLSQLTCLDLVSLGHKQFYTCILMAHACRDNLEILRLNFCRQSQLESGIAMDENSELHRILRESPGIIFPKLKVLDLGVWHEEHSMSRRGSGLDRDLSRVFILPSLEDLTIVYRGLNHSKERLRTQIQQGKMKVSTLCHWSLDAGMDCGSCGFPISASKGTANTLDTTLIPTSYPKMPSTTWKG